jgi:hypothetical protein
MGIETDWNCAISLRPLAEPNTPDPHRMTSEYADWDVKARLPHGIAAIREHTVNVGERLEASAARTWNIGLTETLVS